MDTLTLAPSVNSLEVFLDAENGKLLFSGRSYPENSIVFFKPVTEWIEQYALRPAAITQCSFKLEYCNSASRKCIIDILKTLEGMNKKGLSAVTIIWCFEKGDESMKETGEEYQNLFRLNFQFMPE